MSVNTWPGIGGESIRYVSGRRSGGGRGSRLGLRKSEAVDATAVRPSKIRRVGNISDPRLIAMRNNSSYDDNTGVRDRFPRQSQ